MLAGGTELRQQFRIIWLMFLLEMWQIITSFHYMRPREPPAQLSPLHQQKVIDQVLLL